MAPCHVGHPSSYVTAALGSCSTLSFWSLGQSQPLSDVMGQDTVVLILAFKTTTWNFENTWELASFCKEKWNKTKFSILAKETGCFRQFSSSGFFFSFWNLIISNCLSSLGLSLHFDICREDLLAQVVKAWSLTRYQAHFKSFVLVNRKFSFLELETVFVTSTPTPHPTRSRERLHSEETVSPFNKAIVCAVVS